MIRRGEIWWAALDPPRRSEPGVRRPVLIVQADGFNKSRIPTAIVAVVTRSLRLADAPGNVRLRRGTAGLKSASVVNVSQLVTIDRTRLVERMGRLSPLKMESVEAGLRLVLGFV